MIDPGTVQAGIEAASFAIDLWKWLQKDLTKLVVTKSDRFLEYDPGELRGYYASERPVAPALTYVLAADLLGIPDRRIAAPHCQRVLLEHLQRPFNLATGRGSWSKTSAAGYDALLKSGRVKENESLIRVANFHIDGNALVLKVHEAKYHDQARSNLILDFDRDNAPQYQTLRSQLQSKYGTRLPDISDRNLANTLGVAILIFYKSNGRWVPYLVRRVKKIGVFPGGIHCSASGAAKWTAGRGNPSFEDVTAHLLDEVHEELGLIPKDLQSVEPVAFCREMARGGKPQLFFCALTHLGRRELAEKRKHAARVAKEHKLWTEIERDRWFRSADVVMTPSRLRYGLETWGVTLEGAAALYFGTHYVRRLAGEV